MGYKLSRYYKLPIFHKTLKHATNKEQCKNGPLDIETATQNESIHRMNTYYYDPHTSEICLYNEQTGAR